METNPPLPKPTSEKPGLVTTITILTLINGILNILWGLGVTLSLVVGTLGFGMLCAWITILPLVLGIFEVLYATKLLSTPPQPVKPNQTIAILEIVCIITGNVISALVGILALVFYSDPAVKAYFDQLAGQLPPAPIVPAEPVPPAPVAEPAPKPKRKSGGTSS